MTDWIQSHQTLLAWLGAGSVVALLATPALLAFVLVRIPPDTFTRDRTEARASSRHPVLRVAMKILKNLTGALLVLAGIAMLLLPGQGLLTIVVGVMLLEFPGKRALEVRILANRRIHRAIDRLRARFGHPPLEIPEPAPRI